MTPYLDDGDVRLYAGDCREVMRELAEGSVAAVVTDPPYGLEFMGKEWDRFGRNAPPSFEHSMQGWKGFKPLPRPGGLAPDGMRAFGDWCCEWATEALRVLAPGGHLLAFGGARTYHRLVCAIEDAGFEIRDTITWHYGSGFPKSLDVSKAIDREAGAEREDVYEDKPGVVSNIAYGKGLGVGLVERRPATPEAARWQGWGTALKPATELIVVARKPLAERTVARQVLATGTGALNVDGCRVATDDNRARFNHARNSGTSYVVQREDALIDPGGAGRWPPNLVLDDAAAAEMDAQSGERPTGDIRPYRSASNGYEGGWGRDRPSVHVGDTGGASRFFPRFRYEAKADGAERDGATHPTVKPLALMRWLVRLVTPPGGTVLDPFSGSGTTLLAAREEGLRAIGIEREAEYLRMAAHRLRQLSLLAEAIA